MYPMSPFEKMMAFAQHCAATDASFTPFENRFWHPLEMILDILLKQIEDKKIVPFRSVDDLKNKTRTPNEARLPRFEPCLRSLVNCWGKAGNYVSHNNPQFLLNIVKPDLDACRTFVCSDAKNFSQCINPAFKDEILTRGIEGARRTGLPGLPVGGFAAWQAARQVRVKVPTRDRHNNKTADSTAQTVQTTQTKNTAWNAEHVRQMKNQVYRKRAGECTSFGYASGHILKSAADARNLDFRVEVVVSSDMVPKPVTEKDPNWKPGDDPKKKYRQIVDRKRKKWSLFYKNVPRVKDTEITHVFCVLNRQGGTQDVTVGRAGEMKKKLPPVEQWGPDCYIVDTWLTSLGWPSIYPCRQYKFMSMLKNVYQEMDTLGG